MLEEVLRYVNNRFERTRKAGRFSVSGGSLEIAGMPEGQYYWVEGSALNDGLHRHPDRNMRDEDFEGAVVTLAVPRALVELADEIEEWCGANAEAVSGPYQSESFGGYSYTMAGASGDGRLPATAWQAHFAARLRPYRKLSRDWT